MKIKNLTFISLYNILTNMNYILILFCFYHLNINVLSFKLIFNKIYNKLNFIDKLYLLYPSSGF